MGRRRREGPRHAKGPQRQLIGSANEEQVSTVKDSRLNEKVKQNKQASMRGLRSRSVRARELGNAALG